jgi:hypothetical protein
MELNEEYFEKTKTDNWFKFSDKLICTFEDGNVFISDGEFNYPLKHIKTVKQWEDLHLNLTGKKL